MFNFIAPSSPHAFRLKQNCPLVQLSQLAHPILQVCICVIFWRKCMHSRGSRFVYLNGHLACVPTNLDEFFLTFVVSDAENVSPFCMFTVIFSGLGLAMSAGNYVIKTANSCIGKLSLHFPFILFYQSVCLNFCKSFVFILQVHSEHTCIRHIQSWTTRSLWSCEP